NPGRCKNFQGFWMQRKATWQGNKAKALDLFHQTYTQENGSPTTIILGVSCVYKSRTGLPGHLAAAAAEFQTQTGFPGHLAEVHMKLLTQELLSFKPKRASQAI